MEHVYTLLMLIVPSSVLCGRVPAPVHLRMSSQHFIHLLTWQPGPGSPAGLHYDVNFCTYGGNWMVVDGCVAVRFPLRCNLTDVFSDFDKTYYVNITAFSGTQRSPSVNYPPFKPVDDTLLEPPSLQVSPCNRSLCVYLRSPSERLLSAYNKFDYTLNITNEKGVQFLRTFKGLKTENLSVVPGLEYCVSVNLTDREVSGSKPAVCASVPVAVNHMDAVFSVVLCLLMMAVLLLSGRCVLKKSLHLTRRLPLVLSSFKPPYAPWILSWPSVESLQCISVEPRTIEDAQVTEELDQEKECDVVAYEGRRNCEEVAEETQSSLSSSPEVRSEPTSCASPETRTRVPKTFLKESTSAPDVTTLDGEETPSRSTSLTHLLPLTPAQGWEKSDLALLGNKSGDELGQEEEEGVEEEKEDSDDVNFFSLTLGGRNSKQEETEIEEKMENMKIWKPELPLIVLRPADLPGLDIRPMCSEGTSYSEEGEEEEEEGLEDEEAFSGYMMRT